jgi:phosphoribosylcarboxyaminoimidazole (NCAIR) mutase
VEVVSAHRNPKKVEELARKDYDVFIAIAGFGANCPHDRTKDKKLRLALPRL